MNFMGSRSTRRNYGKMRSAVTAVARERIELLLSQAIEILPRDTDLAKRYVGLAQRISTRTKVRIPKDMKHYLCKNCGQPLIPGKNARIRLRSGNSRIIIGGTSDAPPFSERCTYEDRSECHGCGSSMEDVRVTGIGPLTTYPQEAPPLGSPCNSFRRQNLSPWMGRKAGN